LPNLQSLVAPLKWTAIRHIYPWSKKTQPRADKAAPVCRDGDRSCRRPYLVLDR